MQKSLVLVLLVVAAVALKEVHATSYMLEKFHKGWKDRWTVSDWKKDEGINGKFGWSAGKFAGDSEEDKGAMTTQDARFYAMSRSLDKVGQNNTFSNEGKDFILQFSVKWPQGMDCGGGYIKLFRQGIDQKTVSGDTDYAVMFGPDVCGTTTRKVHAILNYKGKNVPLNKDVKCEYDRFTHVYTLWLKKDNTYEIRVDGEVRESGDIAKDWDLLEPEMIPDPDASKPLNWVDEEFIPDPDAIKPDHWDDIPEKIPDPEAEQPEDWDEDADGEWQAPTIDNPDFRGEWRAPMIENPEYVGKWEHPLIKNPDFEPDEELYVQRDLAFAGFELWQVKSGSVFDNIIVTDTIEEAEDLMDETYFKMKELERKAADELEAERRRKEAAERPPEDDEDEFADDDDEDEFDRDEL